MSEAPKNPAESNKTKVPQLNETTGLSYDYRNSYLGLVEDFPLRGGTERLRSYLKGLREENRVIKKYEERFPSSVYRDVINEKNRNAVGKMDALVDSLNEKIRDIDTLTEEDILRICFELETLIKGE